MGARTTDTAPTTEHWTDPFIVGDAPREWAVALRRGAGRCGLQVGGFRSSRAAYQWIETESGAWLSRLDPRSVPAWWKSMS